MSDFHKAMTGLYCVLPELPVAEALQYLSIAAQLEAFHAHLPMLARGDAIAPSGAC